MTISAMTTDTLSAPAPAASASYRKLRRHYDAIITAAARALDDRRRSDELRGLTPRRLYMWFAPSGPGQWGGIAFAEESDATFCRLAYPEPVSPSLRGDAARAWIADRARLLPIYPQWG